MTRPQTLPRAAITKLLAPRTIAVVGASDKPGALGATVIANLDRNGYAGDIYPINPKRETIGARAGQIVRDYRVPKWLCRMLMAGKAVVRTRGASLGVVLGPKIAEGKGEAPLVL